MTELADRNDYLSTGVHIGMKEKNKHMDHFVFKRRPDGIAVLDIEKTDERIKVAGKFISTFKPEKTLIVSRKSGGQDYVKKFADTIGARNITGRFFPGALTNPSFKNYFEADLLIITDSSIDRQAVKEAIQRRIPIVSLCNTNNDTSFNDLIIPTNNKGAKSVGLVLYLLAKEVLKNRGEEAEIDMKDFIGE